MNIYPREKYVQQLLSLQRNGLVKIVIGLRRVGKSYLLFSLFRQRLLQEREHTLNELEKMENIRQYLVANGVVDDDSFIDFIKED